ncbi:MAG TPA: hypothetical protein VKU83_03875, partial [Puia sp.]|nr:hypothetical protein [Puia sp.]
MRLIPKPRIVVHRKIAWLLVFSILSLMVVGYLIYATKRSMGQTNFRINRTYEAISTLQRLNLLATESGSEAYRYAQTADGQDAQDLTRSHAGLMAFLDSLQQLTAGNCDQDSSISRLSGLIDTKCRAEDSLVANKTSPEPGRLASADRAVKQLLESMTLTERRLLTDRMQLNEDENRRTAEIALIARIAACFFVVFILIKINGDISHRKKAQDRLEIAIREARDAKLMQEQF